MLSKDTARAGRFAIRTRTGQGGFTLVETFVGLIVLALIVPGTVAAIGAMASATQRLNLQERMDLALTSFGEEVKTLPYVSCAQSSSYQTAYDTTQTNQPSEFRVNQLGSGFSFEITGVTPCSANTPPIDSGTQTVDLRIRQIDGSTPPNTIREAVGSVVKRSPDTSVAIVILAQPISSAGSAVNSFLLTADVSRPYSEYRWDCGQGTSPSTPSKYPDPDASTPQPITDPKAADVICSYSAGSTDATRSITLTCVDAAGATQVVVLPVTVYAAANAAAGPTVELAFSPNAQTDKTKTFVATVTGAVVLWEWNFGDTASGAANTDTCNSSSCGSRTHTFANNGSYTVSLSVTDQAGAKSTAVATVVIDVPGSPPVALFSRTPSVGVAPQLVTLDASASHAYGAASGIGISSYVWTIGSTTLSGMTANINLGAAGNYTVTLTVTAASGFPGAGSSNSVTQTISLSALLAPSNFRLTDAEGELAHDGRFYFAWTNVPRTAGDVLSVEIEVRATWGCVAFGDQTRTVPAGAAGSAQYYTFSVSWPFSNVCLWSYYEHRARTKRTVGTTVSYSAWTPWVERQITHT